MTEFRLNYEGALFHRIVKNGWIQGGGGHHRAGTQVLSTHVLQYLDTGRRWAQQGRHTSTQYSCTPVLGYREEVGTTGPAQEYSVLTYSSTWIQRGGGHQRAGTPVLSTHVLQYLDTGRRWAPQGRHTSTQYSRTPVLGYREEVGTTGPAHKYSVLMYSSTWIEGGGGHHRAGTQVLSTHILQYLDTGRRWAPQGRHTSTQYSRTPVLGYREEVGTTGPAHKYSVLMYSSTWIQGGGGHHRAGTQVLSTHVLQYLDTGRRWAHL